MLPAHGTTFVIPHHCRLVSGSRGRGVGLLALSPSPDRPDPPRGQCVPAAHREEPAAAGPRPDTTCSSAYNNSNKSTRQNIVGPKRRSAVGLCGRSREDICRAG